MVIVAVLKPQMMGSLLLSTDCTFLALSEVVDMVLLAMTDISSVFNFLTWFIMSFFFRVWFTFHWFLLGVH
jgi:hypothetical protein